MHHVRRYVQHLVRAHNEGLPIYVEPPPAAHHECQLLVLMIMWRHVAPLFALHPRDHHGPVPGQLADELVIDPLFWNLVPFEMLHHPHHRLDLLRASDSTTVWLVVASCRLQVAVASYCCKLLLQVTVASCRLTLSCRLPVARMG